jgi:chemotaxis protein methyltransferase CheR
MEKIMNIIIDDIKTSAFERDFEYTRDDFLFIKETLYKQSGIDLHDGKQTMVYSRLNRRLKELNIQSFHEYCNYINSEKGSGELVHFVNALTTNLTHFFRENHHFEHLKNVVLPAHLASERKNRMRIWSAGCSTGEEPYSIAMTVLENPNIKSIDLKILATDIDTTVIGSAQKSNYANGEGIPEPYLQKYCDVNASKNITIKPFVKNLITFNPLNLLEVWPMQGPFDLIFCRNTVIYFNKSTQTVLFDKFAEILAPNGWLYIGHSESLFNVTDRFELVGKSIYKRKF